MDSRRTDEEKIETETQMLPKEPPDPVGSPTWLDVLPQIISSCVAHALVIHVGIHMAYSTVQIPHLSLTTDQSSWLAGLVTIANPLGALCIGPIMDRLGRKLSLLLVCVPFSISPLLSLMAEPSDVGLLYASKIFAGVGCGMSTVVMVYVSEISHADYRPALLCLNSAFCSFGILLTSLLNLYLHWTSLSICFLSLILLTGALLLFLAPESPHWLINLDTSSGGNQRVAKAQTSLKYFNPNKKVYEREWRTLNHARIKYNVTSDEGPLLRRILRTKQCYKPLIILLILLSLQQMTGVYSVIFYAMQLFKQVGTGFGSESTALVYLALIRFVMSVAATVLAKGFGRKPLMIVSAAGICVFSLLLSATMFMKSTTEICHQIDVYNSTHLLLSDPRVNYIPNTTTSLSNNTVNVNITSPILSQEPISTSAIYMNDINQTIERNGTKLHNHMRQHHSQRFNPSQSSQNVNLPCTPSSTLSSDHFSLLCILLYVCFSAVGVFVIPWTMIAELLPDFARGTCSGFLISYGYVWMFIMVKCFLAVLEYSVMATFGAFGIMSIILMAFVYFYVPETRGKSFVEIQRFFS